MVLELSALATVDVLVAVAGESAGAAIDPTGDTVEMAFVGERVEPASGDWQTASWETSGSTYYAKCLVGPGGAVSLTAGTVYAVWVRVTDNPETVVARVGYVKSY